MWYSLEGRPSATKKVIIWEIKYFCYLLFLRGAFNCSVYNKNLYRNRHNLK